MGRTIAMIGILSIALVAFDNAIHEPVDQPTAYLVLLWVDFYQDFLSPIVAPQGTCKFVPPCSDYMKLAVLKNGSIKGVGLGIWRVLRCSPFTSQRGYDYPSP